MTCSSGEVTRLSLGDNGLSGTIPTQIGLLTALSVNLEMQSDAGLNDIRGTLPTEIGQLTNLLKQVALQNNKLSGPLPVSE